MPSKHLCTITTNSFQKRYWRRQFSHCFPLQGWGKQNLKTAEFFQKEPNTKYSYVFSLPTLKINLPFPYERSPSACTRLAGAALHVRTLCYTLQSTKQLLPYEQCCKRTLQWTSTSHSLHGHPDTVADISSLFQSLRARKHFSNFKVEQQELHFPCIQLLKHTFTLIPN